MKANTFCQTRASLFIFMFLKPLSIANMIQFIFSLSVPIPNALTKSSMNCVCKRYLLFIMYSYIKFFSYYSIRISTHWIGMCAQLARFYSPFLLPMLFAIFLHCFSRQLKEKRSNNAVPSILSCLVEMPVIKMALIPEAFSIFLGYY